MFYVYVLVSLRNSKRYVGYTKLLPEERLKQHSAGTNKWTSQNGPFELVYTEEYVTSVEARKRERFLKMGVGRKELDKILKARREWVSINGLSFSRRLIRLWRRLERLTYIPRQRRVRYWRKKAEGSSPSSPIFLCWSLRGWQENWLQNAGLSVIIFSITEHWYLTTEYFSWARGVAWLTYLTVDQKIASSNLVGPAKYKTPYHTMWGFLLMETCSISDCSRQSRDDVRISSGPPNIKPHIF